MSREAEREEYFVIDHDGNPIVFFTKDYTEQVLHANWYGGTNPKVPPRFGEAIKPEGGSWSWDLRLRYYEKQRSDPPLRSRPSTAHGPRDAEAGEFIVLEHSGNPIVYFTKDYTERVLRGNWHKGNDPLVPAEFGEAIKPAGGSWSWDLRLYYKEKQQSGPPQQFRPPSARQPSRPSTASKNAPAFSGHADVFLSHKWGSDAQNRDNHARVARIRDELERRGIHCWFDELHMAGNINAAMAEGIENCKCFVAFITDKYRNDINSKVDNNCRSEFNHAKLMKGSHQMLAVVLEEGMRNPRDWHGELGFALGSKLFVDLCSDDEHHWQQGISKLYESITALLG